MGVDLRLMPLLGMAPGIRAAHDMMELARNPGLFDAIERLPQQPIVGPLTCFLAPIDHPKTDSCYGEIEETPYGKRLTTTTAGDLMTLSDHAGVRNHWRNRAAWAYLAEIPSDWLIVLYWH